MHGPPCRNLGQRHQSKFTRKKNLSRRTHAAPCRRPRQNMSPYATRSPMYAATLRYSMSSSQTSSLKPTGRGPGNRQTTINAYIGGSASTARSSHARRPAYHRAALRFTLALAPLDLGLCLGRPTAACKQTAYVAALMASSSCPDAVLSNVRRLRTARFWEMKMALRLGRDGPGHVRYARRPECPPPFAISAGPCWPIQSLSSRN